MDSRSITEDAILGGRVRIRQPGQGYRVNVDTLLLSAALPEVAARAGAHVAEPGCGVAAALLAVAARSGEITCTFVGVERDPLYAALARENIELNKQTSRAKIIEADALDLQGEFGLFDFVIFNPPFDEPGEGRAPSEAKRAAFVAERPIEHWIKAWSNRMRAHSCMAFIHRAHKLPQILSALEGRLGGIEVFPIRAHAHAKASRVIVRAWKGSRAPLKLLRGLDLHPGDTSQDKYTPEADAILRGVTHISFG